MQIHVTDHNQELCIRPDCDRLDMPVAATFRKRCIEAAQATKSLVIDLSLVRFIDSSGLGAMVGILNALGPDGRIALVAPQKSTRMLLEVTGLDTVFSVYESLDRVPA
ncbi:MAG: STAS domain-containing protein [Betaproteobacteria bacterium]|nr:STAS domain-containing protein [Betaproteobacteria bacterium]